MLHHPTTRSSPLSYISVSPIPSNYSPQVLQPIHIPRWTSTLEQTSLWDLCNFSISSIPPLPQSTSSAVDVFYYHQQDGHSKLKSNLLGNSYGNPVDPLVSKLLVLDETHRNICCLVLPALVRVNIIVIVTSNISPAIWGRGNVGGIGRVRGR